MDLITLIPCKIYMDFAIHTATSDIPKSKQEALLSSAAVEDNLAVE